MKALIFIMLFSSGALADLYLEFSGYAYHGKSTNKDGRVYDKFIEGIGLQYRTQCVGKGLSCNTTFMAISDSNANMMYAGTVGVSYNVVKYINLGADIGIGSRKIYALDNNGYKLDYRVRKIIPVGIPKMEIDFNTVIINVAYAPTIKVLHISELLYITFGLRF